MPGSFDDEDRKASNGSDWESDDGDNDDSDEVTESEEEEDDEDRSDDDDDEDEGDDEDEDEDEQNRDEDEDEEDDDKSDDDDDDDDPYADEENGLRYQDDDDDARELGAAGLEQHPYQDEPVETDKNKDRETTQKTLLACFLCCICLILVASAVVLGVIFSKGGNSAESSTPPTATPMAPISTPELLTTTPVQRLPTLAPWPTIAPSVSVSPTNASSEFPTYAPTPFPSMSPTISLEPTDPVPDELLLVPEEDTYIVIGGFSPGESRGKEESLLVQNGPLGVNEVPDAYALLLFSLEDLPQAWRITDREPQAILRLTQVIRPNVEELAPSNLTVTRLPSTPLAVETLDGMMFVPYDGVPGPSFMVNATQRRIEVDITSLIFDQPPFVPSRRQLQGKGSQFFIMIENLGSEQADGGNRFSSRESTNPPELYIGLFKPGDPRPTRSPTPSPTTSPQPSFSAAPTTINMTADSTQPSFISVTSVQPTVILPVGSKVPTISNETFSPAPTNSEIEIR